MPKKRKKNPKTKSPKQARDSSSSDSVEQPANPPRKGIFQDKKQLFYYLSSAPLVLGALSVHGGYIQRFMELSLIVLAIAISNSIEGVTKSQNKDQFSEVTKGALVAIQVMSVLAFGYATKNVYAISILVITILIMMLRSRVGLDEPRKLLLGVVLLISQAVLLSVLGEYSQRLAIYPAVSAFLGLVPGLMLSAALVVENASVFEKAGWNRIRLVTDRKGEVKKRPAKLSTLFSLLLIFFPALAVVMSFPPLSLISSVYCLAVIVLAYTPKLAQAFYEGTKTDREVFDSTVKLTGWMVILLVLLGLG